MLCRTADNLYWMARYMERADFTARLLDAAARLASLPSHYGDSGAEWESAVAITDVRDAYYEARGAATEENVRDYLAFDLANPSSISSCLEKARENARSVRTALTREAWESINDAWNELSRKRSARAGMIEGEAFAEFCEWVKGAVSGFDGAAHRSMMRNDAYWFLRLGQAVERADNTARILDVKYHLLLPEGEEVGGTLDYFQWTTILREVSALTAYRWAYRENIKPWLVADLLILNRQMPRSLACCYEDAAHHLDLLGQAYGRRGPAQKLASATLGRLSGLRIEEVIQKGLHEFVTGFVADNHRLGAVISEQYLL